MKKLTHLFVFIALGLLLFTSTAFAEGEINVYRLYNNSTGEHLYTSDHGEVEALVLQYGWKDEGTGWVGSNAGNGVYRLFNPAISDHLYTTDTNETTELTQNGGWSMDNGGQPLFYSAGGVEVYRLYNPQTGRHHLTQDANEYNVLGQNGWNQEGVGLLALGGGNPTPTTPAVTIPGAVPGVAGLRTVKNFLQIALGPVGTTSYVWGGGWNEPDNAAGPEGMHIGVVPRWKEFFDQQNAAYDYNNTRYQIHDGLDCSGYVGWAVYNLLNTESGIEANQEVYGANKQARIFAEKGYGSYTPFGQIQQFLPGDVVSLEKDGHVYICIGQCPDGSVVLVHASPPGVMISGTTTADGKPTQATMLSEAYMRNYYPEYYNRYSSKLSRSRQYMTRSAKMSWGDNFVGDPDGIRALDAHSVLKILFNEQ